jgi:hypothetical protein
VYQSALSVELLMGEQFAVKVIAGALTILFKSSCGPLHQVDRIRRYREQPISKKCEQEKGYTHLLRPAGES